MRWPSAQLGLGAGPARRPFARAPLTRRRAGDRLRPARRAWGRRVWLVLAALLVALVATGARAATDAPGATAEPIELHFFWSQSCPHCRRARPFVEALPDTHPWLVVHSLDVADDPANVALYVEMAAALGEQARSVPAFLFCGRMFTGYDSAQTTGRALESLLMECRARRLGADGDPAAAAAPPLVVPLLGPVDLERYSLPALTLVLAGLDSFNPCAFFVLLFLLSLLVHARSRSRILLVGGIFVAFSGIVYFVFMAAWLNLFLVVGRLSLATTLAGALALVIGALNVKDYVWMKRGPTLSIPEGAKPGLFQRMRALVAGESTPALVGGAMVLALAANTYELLCTAGFPMVFTRALTLNELSSAEHYLYLALYNAIYVVPLALVVVVFAVTLGARKLGEREGRILKLVSGLMMAGLGLVLLIEPELLNNALIAAALLLGAVALTALVELARRAVAHDRPRALR